MNSVHPTIPLVLSPNRSDRKGQSIIGTVIHYTASKPGTRGDIAWLCDPRASASAHFVIGRDGSTTQLVPIEEAAWHAGVSQMKMPDNTILKNCNLFTIGIELDNLGYLVRDDDESGFSFEEGNSLKPYDGPTPVHAALIYDNGVRVEGWWEPYPDAQIESLAKLLRLLADAGHKDAIHNLVGHEEIAMPFGTRKRDPGSAFEWNRFARKLPRRTSTEIISQA
jgi:N-acetyl-anhydromuramyl-L-alanine amidase AmpD